VNQLVKQNGRHFPKSSTEQYGIEVRNPDEFLMNVVDLYPRQTLVAVRRQAEALRRDRGMDVVVRRLAAQVPKFAQAIDTLIRAGA
jgi:hypothetical protein